MAVTVSSLFAAAEAKVMAYRRDRSRRVTESRPHAAQMDVALDENAEVNVIRGPNSSTTTSVVLLVNADVSSCNPPLSNVSANNHSRREVSCSFKVPLESCTLKHDSVSMRRMEAACSVVSCSLMEGNRECGVGVLR